MSEEVLDILNNRVRCTHHNFIFYGAKNKPFKQKTAFKDRFKEAYYKVGIPYGRKIENGCTIHDIRRMVKTNMATTRVGDGDKRYADIILGHALALWTDGISSHLLKSYTKR